MELLLYRQTRTLFDNYHYFHAVFPFVLSSQIIYNSLLNESSQHIESEITLGSTVILFFNRQSSKPHNEMANKNDTMM